MHSSFIHYHCSASIHSFFHKDTHGTNHVHTHMEAWRQADRKRKTLLYRTTHGLPHERHMTTDRTRQENKSKPGHPSTHYVLYHRQRNSQTERPSDRPRAPDAGR